MEKEVGIVSATLQEESYKASQLGKTVENLKINQKRLETEMVKKQSLEVELTRVQGQLTKEEGKVAEMEKEVKEREEKVKVLERNIERLEKRRQSSDKVFAALAKEGEKENFATLNGGISPGRSWKLPWSHPDLDPDWMLGHLSSNPDLELAKVRLQ